MNLPGQSSQSSILSRDRPLPLRHQVQALLFSMRFPWAHTGFRRRLLRWAGSWMIPSTPPRWWPVRPPQSLSSTRSYRDCGSSNMIEKYGRHAQCHFRCLSGWRILGNFKTDQFGEILIADAEPGTYRAFEVDTGDEGHILDTTPQEVELHAGDGIKELMFSTT